MPEDVCFVVALMLAAVLAAAGLPSENIVYPRILQSRDLNGEKTLYIRPGLVLSLEKSRVFSDNFIFSEDDGVNRHDKLMNGKDLENNFYQDRNRASVVFVDEEKGAVEVRGILNNKFSIEPVASSRRSEDDLVAHRLLDLEDIDNPLGDKSVQDLSLSAQDVGLSTPEATGRNLENLPEEFVVEVRIFSDPSFGPNKTMDDLIQYFGLVMSKVNQYYKQLSKPKVQFIVLSITRLTNYTFTRLIPDPEDDRSLIDLCGTMGSFSKYVNATLTKDTQDAVIYVTSLLNGFISGCGFSCRVCEESPITTQTLTFGPPGTGGPYVIAHQLGHLLGMSHEGSPPEYYTPGNKNLRCEKKDFGSVMGSGQPPHYFSHCVQDQARGCLMTKTKQCFELTGGKKIF
ncbi:LOW QUALITY PROTEIN: venom metalloproteinase antarease-like TtrivMP_A [Ixodes scapularis]|uniref:LOW QUALITY PROTEIN: venom metalloproteinase antarease-like TtrivMP_A n=1 Tax=Ixodes scapularis TaxID=6945 RepID=UPI001C37EAE1|nr:LOW QUALITY PROTEIN: venom metalloproteinase antarease-like TtrivMP_A [Ixodes scapularis]